MPLACQPKRDSSKTRKAPPPAPAAVRSPPNLQKSKKSRKTRLKADREGPGKFPKGPLPDGTLQKGPFMVGSKLLTSGKRRRAARPSGRRTLRYSSSLTKKARSKLGQFNFFRTLTSHGPLNFPNPITVAAFLAQTSGQNHPKIPNFPLVKRADPGPQGALGRELSIPRGPGLLRPSTSQIRILTRPPPIWTGPFWGVPYASAAPNLTLEKD